MGWYRMTPGSGGGGGDSDNYFTLKLKNVGRQSSAGDFVGLLGTKTNISDVELSFPDETYFNYRSNLTNIIYNTNNINNLSIIFNNNCGQVYFNNLLNNVRCDNFYFVPPLNFVSYGITNNFYCNNSSDFHFDNIVNKNLNNLFINSSFGNSNISFNNCNNINFNEAFKFTNFYSSNIYIYNTGNIKNGFNQFYNTIYGNIFFYEENFNNMILNNAFAYSQINLKAPNQILYFYNCNCLNLMTNTNISGQDVKTLVFYNCNIGNFDNIISTEDNRINIVFDGPAISNAKSYNNFLFLSINNQVFTNSIRSITFKNINGQNTTIANNSLYCINKASTVSLTSYSALSTDFIFNNCKINNDRGLIAACSGIVQNGDLQIEGPGEYLLNTQSFNNFSKYYSGPSNMCINNFKGNFTYSVADSYNLQFRNFYSNDSNNVLILFNINQCASSSKQNFYLKNTKNFCLSFSSQTRNSGINTNFYIYDCNRRESTDTSIFSMPSNYLPNGYMNFYFKNIEDIPMDNLKNLIYFNDSYSSSYIYIFAKNIDNFKTTSIFKNKNYSSQTQRNENCQYTGRIYLINNYTG